MRNLPRERRFSARTIKAFTEANLPATLAVKAAAAADSAEILLYDEIGTWGITAADFAGALKATGGGDVCVRINSPGGDVFDGLAIYNLLNAHPGKVSVVIDGLAASAASVIAMAGDTIEMAASAFMMIHNAWGIVVGNRNDMRATADTLQKIDGQLADIYADRSGCDQDAVTAMMDAETWLTADECKSQGFCDCVTEPPEKGDGKDTAKNRAFSGFSAMLGALPQPLADIATEEWRAKAARQLRLAEMCGM